VAHQSADHLLYSSAVEDVNIKVIPLVVNVSESQAQLR